MRQPRLFWTMLLVLLLGHAAAAGAVCTPDAYEDDDTPATARWIAANTTQTHNFCADTVDWFAFDAVAGTTYGLQNRAVSYRYDSRLLLYAGDGVTLLASSGYFTDENPRITWTAPASGRFYLRSGASHTGADTVYEFTIADVLPDLVVDDFTTDKLRALAGGTEWIYAAVANRGFADAAPFELGLYLSTDASVTREDLRVGYTRVDTLAGGTNGVLAWTLAAFPPGMVGTFYLGAIVDDRDQVAEYFEDNNTADHTVQVLLEAPECAIDAYEEDDTRDMAQPISANQAQLRNHCEDPYDWVYFDALAGETYYVRARNNQGPDWYRHIIVFDAQGAEVATGDGLAQWTAPATGRYYIEIWRHMLWNDPGYYYLEVMGELPDLAAGYGYFIDPWFPIGGVIDRFAFGLSNIGFAPSITAEVGYFLSSDSEITLSDRRIGEGSVPPLAVGEYYERREITVVLPTDLTAGTYYLGPYYDPANQLPETDETNNVIVQPLWLELQEPVCPPDAYEADDVRAQARRLSVDAPQAHNFCEDGHDWLTLTAQAGVTYAIQADYEDWYDASQIKVYDRDGVTRLADSEWARDASGGSHAWAAFTAPADGPYFIHLHNKAVDGYSTRWGAGTAYSLIAETCEPDAYEADDALAEARALALSELQTRNHCEDGSDWVALEIPRAGGYRIETSGLEAEADTVLALYDVDGVTLLAENDNAGNRKPESRIDWSFAQAGTYYLEVGARNRGPGTGYWLGLTPVKGRVK